MPKNTFSAQNPAREAYSGHSGIRIAPALPPRRVSPPSQIPEHMRRRRGAGGHVPTPTPPPQKKNRENIFRQLLCKIRAFSGKNHVKFGNFVHISDKYNKSSDIFRARIV